MSQYAFLHTTKPSLAFSFTVWLPPTGSRRACTETVYNVERETGLEPGDQPAWKAGCHCFCARLLRTGFIGSCTPYQTKCERP
jgi:hypothetical protein